ncbi:N-acetyl-glucosamine-6-phosphate deacetylase [Tulasnella sp. 419]|nr:N-acetyl-glucosamine-6-phosphate deacetylase [Tulasnella sp. 419]
MEQQPLLQQIIQWVLGLFRGLTTFSQLFYTAGPTVYTYNAPIAIKDKAAFPHRGLLLDTARNYYPKADVLRTIDAMSWTKLNVLHWHIVDSQSFPLEVARYPELAKTGAYDPSSIYKISDIKEIVKYAGERGVDILLEIDTPGHTAVVSKSHPEFIACNEKVPWTKYANEPPAGQLRLASKDVITFTSQLFASVLENLPGKYFSTGGDEINANCYTEDPETQAQLKANGQTLDQALDVFTKETHAVVTKAGKSPVVWEEMVLNHNVTLSPDTVVMVWVSSGNAAAVAKKGFKLVQTPSDYFYLDCGGGGWVGANPNGNSWCDPYKTEQSDPNTLDEKLWPRAAAAAEVFWTGANGPDGKPRNGTEAFQRIHDLR